MGRSIANISLPNPNLKLPHYVNILFYEIALRAERNALRWTWTTVLCTTIKFKCKDILKFGLKLLPQKAVAVALQSK